MKARRQLPVLVVDTREQEPYLFDPAKVQVEVRALPSGDYSVSGLEHRVAVERKSLDDFVLSVIHEWDRFERELGRLAVYERAWVVVEGTMGDAAAGRYTSRVNGAAVLGRATQISVDFGLPVLWCGDRPRARQATESHLLRFAQRFARPPEPTDVPSDEPDQG